MDYEYADDLMDWETMQVYQDRWMDEEDDYSSSYSTDDDWDDEII